MDGEPRKRNFKLFYKIAIGYVPFHEGTCISHYSTSSPICVEFPRTLIRVSPTISTSKSFFVSSERFSNSRLQTSRGLILGSRTRTSRPRF